MRRNLLFSPPAAGAVLTLQIPRTKALMRIMGLAFDSTNAAALRLMLTLVPRNSVNGWSVPLYVTEPAGTMHCSAFVGAPASQERQKNNAAATAVIRDSSSGMAVLCPLPDVEFDQDVTLTVDDEAGGLGGGDTFTNIRVQVEDTDG